MPKNKNHKPVFVEHGALPGEPEAPKSKKRDQKTFEVLKEIYSENGELPDLSRFERERRQPRAIFLGLLAFFAVLALAAWAGFFIFKPYGRFEARGVKLEVEGPEEIKAGEVVQYDCNYRNTERVGLAALELRLVIPKTFHILELDPPQITNPYTWTLGSMPHESDGKIRLRGYFLGPGEGDSAFQSIATYRPANFNADFQAITTKRVDFTGSVFEAILSGPVEVAPGEGAEYIYKVKNTSTEQLTPEIRLEAPSHFIFESASPGSSDEQHTRWTLPALLPSADFELKLKGSFAGDEAGLSSTNFVIGIPFEDDFLAHRRDPFETKVLASAINLTLLVNGSSENRVANFGETLNLSLAFKNPGETALSDITISLLASTDPPGLLSWSHAEMNPVGKREGATVVWTKRELPSLGTLARDAEGTLDLSVPLVQSTTGIGKDEVRLSVTASIGQVGGRRLGRQIQTTPIVISLNSDARFTTEARYFDVEGAPVGSGPLPPKVNEPTSLRIFWIIANSRHDLENVRVRTTLPSRVSWTGRTETGAGRLSWDPGTRTVTYTLDQMLKDAPPASLSFEVQIQPEASDLGKFLTLINETLFEARDTQTGSTLSRRADPLTTDLTNDPQAAGRGAVIE